MLYQLFSSFLRGASCPKSPRAPPLPATLFMRLTGRDVKPEKIWVVGQFEFRFTGKGPNMSLKNRTNTVTEIIAIHHGLSTIGNNKTSSHTHQGVRDHRLLRDFVGFIWSSMQVKGYARIAVRFKG
jgi:hypothetical protein